MADEPTGLNLSLDDIIKKQQDQSTRSGEDRRNRTRGQRQGNYNNGSRHGGGGGGDFDMDGAGGGPVRRHNDGGRDRGHYNVRFETNLLNISIIYTKLILFFPYRDNMAAAAAAVIVLQAVFVIPLARILVVFTAILMATIDMHGVVKSIIVNSKIVMLKMNLVLLCSNTEVVILYELHQKER
jgi:hypothetical protein